MAFFLEGVSQQARDAADTAMRIAGLHREYREALGRANATAAAFSLLDQVFQNPYVTISRAASDIDVSFPTAQRAIDKYLVPAGVLRRLSGHENPRLYEASRIMEVIGGDSR